MKTYNIFVYQIEYLRTLKLEDSHATRIYLYLYSTLGNKSVLSLVMWSETGIFITCLTKLIEDSKGIQFFVHSQTIQDNYNRL